MGSFHPSGLNFLRGDGSVFFVSDDINFDVYRAQATVDSSLERELVGASP